MTTEKPYLHNRFSKKDNTYYVKKIATNLSSIINHTSDMTQEDFGRDEILLDSVMFRPIQISENSDKLSNDFKAYHSSIPWQTIKGLRNRIVYEYGDVDLSVVYDTVKNDIPQLLEQIKSIAE